MSTRWTAAQAARLQRSMAAAVPAGVPSTDGKDLQGPVTQVTFSLDLDSFPSFSPDGTMLAYSSLQKSKLDLFVRSFAPGSQTRQVTDDGQQNVQPDWSPDGQYLVYHSIARGGIWVVPATGGSTRQIAEVGSAPRWSPDGRSVVYQSSEVHGLDVPTAIAPSTLWITTFPGGERRALHEAGHAGRRSQSACLVVGRQARRLHQSVCGAHRGLDHRGRERRAEPSDDLSAELRDASPRRRRSRAVLHRVRSVARCVARRVVGGRASDGGAAGGVVHAH